MINSHFGTLFVVATPIGNLGDITKRAIDVLASVDIVACEHTDRTKQLYARLLIPHTSKQFVTVMDDEKRQSDRLLESLKKGLDVAIVSDAGTPLISDPGSLLIRVAMDAGCQVTPIPGASSMTTLLSVAPLDASNFRYIGFLPAKARKSEMQRVCEEMIASLVPTLFFVSPRSVVAALDALMEAGGAARKLLLGRELTKLHEEVALRTVRQHRAHYATQDSVKGEFVGLLAGSNKTKGSIDEKIGSLIRELSKLGLSSRDISQAVSSSFNVQKREIYNYAKASSSDD